MVVAEINPKTGKEAAVKLNQEFGAGSALFVQTDVGDERSVKRLADATFRSLGSVYAVINNATLALLGAVKDLTVQEWDTSYHVNLRGPALMARAFFPGWSSGAKGFLCACHRQGWPTWRLTKA